ncbi:MAG: carboxypeptidase regulatory-like domain-containing protein [Candidatus Doudnabacteria bacterium]|nr:carboxypeptidase regulatory-like domain-containing protein [Candidatus Doudnabacteria bacterium]
MNKLVLCVLLLVALASHAAQGQNTETRYVRVKVVNGATGQAVSGATVTFAVPYGQTAETTTTNSEGLAKLKLVKLPDNITITKPGYLLASTSVDENNVSTVILVYAEPGSTKTKRPPTRRRKH